ncbi:hypothetical protein AQUCO_03100099v1 [Aquilegia coerulea]|uniref:Uncharacterized protein n=1 Tax=Aquilegia coerulea TaxID=218851 RepID=A0A2G5D0T2_AQUCA|nr:hypothetical protein AQUCO_03100099v1 [Aquilegia coerulea]
MKCPACPNDISEFLQNPQVNRDWMGVIESLKRKSEEESVDVSSEEESACTDEQSETVSEDSAKNGKQDCIKVLKDSPEQKPMRVYKRRNVKGATILSKPDVIVNTKNYAKEKKVVPAVTRGTQDERMEAD